jgi:hypothetical protein
MDHRENDGSDTTKENAAVGEGFEHLAAQLNGLVIADGCAGAPSAVVTQAGSFPRLRLLRPRPEGLRVRHVDTRRADAVEHVARGLRNCISPHVDYSSAVGKGGLVRGATSPAEERELTSAKVMLLPCLASPAHRRSGSPLWTA